MMNKSIAAINGIIISFRKKKSYIIFLSISNYLYTHKERLNEKIIDCFFSLSSQ